MGELPSRALMPPALWDGPGATIDSGSSSCLCSFELLPLLANRLDICGLLLNPPWAYIS